MKSSTILSGLEALSEIKKGVDVLSNAVKSTYGPKGNTVIIYEDNTPKVTKDGVTVARAINLDNPVQDIGVQLVKEAASKTAETAGDGTTTSTILAQGLVQVIYQQLVAGIDPRLIKEELSKALVKAKELIKKNAIPIADTIDGIKHIATISANGDEEIGSLISDVISKIGYEGVITLEESNGFETYSEVVEGMEITKGYISPYFINDSVSRACVLNNPYILLFNGVLNNVKTLFSLLEIIATKEEEILIIANDYSPDVINAILRNVNRGILKICAIRSPGVGEYKKDLLEDISVVTGAKILSKLTNESALVSTTSLNSFGLGRAGKVVVSSSSTSIIRGEGNRDKIIERIETLKESLKNDNPKYLAEDIKSRIAKLSGGVAVIYVGAPTELEMSEKKDRIEDAICATRSAIEEGVVVGAGCIQAILAKELLKNKFSILSYALQYCRDLIYTDSPLTYDKAKEKNILDPAKVTRVSIENAVSVANMFLSTKCVVINKDYESTGSIY